MHCASLGEFEQGRPVLEAIKQQYPSSKIILTFFSPSGYEIRKNYPGADAIFYLPMDSAANARKFIDTINPVLVLWVKYEYWYYYLSALEKRNIPVILISGIFRKDQPFFKWYGGLWRKMLHFFSRFFVQNTYSESLLKQVGIPSEKIIVSGDTRFDRVVNIAEKKESIPGIDDFCGNSKVLIAGSTWEDDEAELVHYIRIHPEIKFVIAPHEVDPHNLKDVKKIFAGAVFYSELVNGDTLPAGTHILIIDNIGILSKLYRYATVTYIGGGFGSDGIHNILEAAVYGKPVIFGPVYEKFAEAVDCIAAGGAFSINNALELERLLNSLFSDESRLQQSGAAAGKYVHEHGGATRTIMDHVKENLLLTN